jgi:serine phosphatase RsbU (regulator of sigma subunit)
LATSASSSAGGLQDPAALLERVNRALQQKAFSDHARQMVAANRRAIVFR